MFDLVSQLNQVASSTRQDAIVKQWASTHSERIQDAGAGIATGGRRQRTPKQSLGMALSQLATLPENLDVMVEKFAEGEREDAATGAARSC